MTVAESLIKKVLELPADKQLQLLNYARQLENTSRPPRRNPEGLLADLPSHLTFEDFQQARKEMWGTSTDHELHRD